MTELKLTHLDKLYWPEAGYTKGDVIDYYRAMADRILPYLADRPLSLNRHPDGIGAPGFFQKDIDTARIPSFLGYETVRAESTGKDVDYAVCNNLESLLYLANLGCIEMNPWHSRTHSLASPDYLVVDIDPSGTTFDEVVAVAKAVQDVLQRSCSGSFPKTSGKRGIHVYVPLSSGHTYDEVRLFGELVARMVNRMLPSITSLAHKPADREGKIHIDYLRNAIGQTLAAPYSLRPVPGATVSAPLSWEEVRPGLIPGNFTIASMRQRTADPWDGFFEARTDLRRAISCLE